MTDAQLAVLLRRIAGQLDALLEQLQFKLPDEMSAIVKNKFLPGIESREFPALYDLQEFRAGLVKDAENLERPTA